MVWASSLVRTSSTHEAFAGGGSVFRIINDAANVELKSYGPLNRNVMASVESMPFFSVGYPDKERVEVTLLNAPALES
jgi:hypothetical protein